MKHPIGTRRLLLIAAGAFFLVVAALWLPAAVPQLQKLPGGIDDTMHYEGTFATYVDPATGATLAQPVSVPLRIDRHVASVKGETGAKRALVRETVVLHIGTRTETMTNTYLIDRSSMKNVPDSRTVVTKEGTYSINLPFDMSSAKTYRMWKPETGTSYPMTHSSGARMTTVDGLKLTRMTGTMPATPVSAAERQTLAAQGMPMQLEPQQMIQRLAAAGIDLNAAGPILRSTLTAAEQSQVLGAFTKPVPLVYKWASTGNALIEHRTGMVVSVRDVTETLTVQPDLSGAAPALAALQSHANVPAIAALLQKLGAVASAPASQVYSLSYGQTPASVTERIEAAKDGVAALRVVRQVVPFAIAGIGLLLFIVAGLIDRRPTEPSAEAEREPTEIRRAA